MTQVAMSMAAVALIIIHGASVERRNQNHQDAKLMVCISMTLLAVAAVVSQVTLPLNG